jgi:hypothetical protein
MASVTIVKVYTESLFADLNYIHMHVSILNNVLCLSPTVYIHF